MLTRGKGSQRRSRGSAFLKAGKWTWRESHFLASLSTCSVIRQNEKIRGHHQAVQVGGRENRSGRARARRNDCQRGQRVSIIGRARPSEFRKSSIFTKIEN